MSVGSSRENIKDVKVNVGVIGSAKQGKSSLVNALMKLTNSHPRAAKVIAEEESRPEDVKHFPHPKFENIVLWDLPGVNSENEATYKELITNRGGKQIQFDLFIVVFKGVLNDVVTVMSARLAKKLKAKILFVRTHFDVTLEGRKRALAVEQLEDDVIEQSEKTVRKEIFETARKSLGFEINNDDIYLLDTGNWKKYDYRKLYSDFLNKSFKWIVDKKYQVLKKRLEDANLMMGIKKASLIFQGEVNEDIINELVVYLNVFELTKKNLRSLENATEFDKNSLIKTVSEALRNNKLVYAGWNSEEDLDMGGWKGVRELLDDGPAAVALGGGGYISSATGAILAGNGIRTAATLGAAASWAGPGLKAAVASLAVSAVLFTVAGTLESKGCDKILTDALDVVKVAAIAKEEFILKLETRQN